MKKISFYILSYIAIIFISGIVFNHISPLAGIFILIIQGIILIYYIEDKLKKSRE